jgi:hypothetical protein
VTPSILLPRWWLCPTTYLGRYSRRMDTRLRDRVLCVDRTLRNASEVARKDSTIGLANFAMLEPIQLLHRPPRIIPRLFWRNKPIPLHCQGVTPPQEVGIRLLAMVQKFSTVAGNAGRRVLARSSTDEHLGRLTESTPRIFRKTNICRAQSAIIEHG